MTHLYKDSEAGRKADCVYFYSAVIIFPLVTHCPCVCVCVCVVFMEIVGEKSRHSLQENMHLITVPLQVIWGKEDQVNSQPHSSDDH